MAAVPARSHDIIDKENNIAGVRGSLEGRWRHSGAAATAILPSDWEDSYFLVMNKPAATCTFDLRDRPPAPVQTIGTLLAELYSGAGPLYRSRAKCCG